MADSPRVYIDASVVVSVLTASQSNVERARLAPSVWVLSQGQQGRLTIVMSPLVVAEVLGGGNVRGAQIPPPERTRRVEEAFNYFRDNEILFVELDRSLAIKAARLAVEHQLRGPDGIHLASALQAGCVRLYTWDHDLLKLDGHEDLGNLECLEPKQEGQGDILTEIQESEAGHSDTS